MEGMITDSQVAAIMKRLGTTDFDLNMLAASIFGAIMDGTPEELIAHRISIHHMCFTVRIKQELGDLNRETVNRMLELIKEICKETQTETEIN